MPRDMGIFPEAAAKGALMQTYTPVPEERRRKERLDAYYEQVRACFLERQDAVTGLLPSHYIADPPSDYRPASVRDNAYGILAVWGLAQAYRRLGDDAARRAELEQAVVNRMRGLLQALLQQFARQDRPRYLLTPPPGLRARSSPPAAGPAERRHGYEVWSRLQPDAIALYLLLLAQMSAAGLPLVTTADEVDLVQNLVYYLGFLCHTPGAGFWEGAPSQQGVDYSASVLGMVKAALEALQGFRFNVAGDLEMAVLVMADDIAKARNTLEALLPRESLARETDAALLSIIGFPAFAVEDDGLVAHTRAGVIGKLQGRYGCKRFPGDAQTPRRRGRAHETDEAAPHDAESQWPLFFTYLLLDGVLRGDREQAQYYRERLDSLLVERNGQRLLPECYAASAAGQPWTPAGGAPLLWAQSLYLLGLLLHEGLIDADAIDPLRRRERPGRKRSNTVQLALLTAEEEVYDRLRALGLPVQTLSEVEPARIHPATRLEAALRELGRNPLQGLPGRPPRQLGSLASCQVFTAADDTPLLFTPAFLSPHEFYLNLDNRLLTAQFKAELKHIHYHWDQPGQPLLNLVITGSMLETCGHQLLLDLLQQCRTGCYNGVPIRLGKLTELLADASRAPLPRLALDSAPGVPSARTPCLQWERTHTRPLPTAAAVALRRQIDSGVLLERLADSRNLYEHIELLGLLWERLGPDFIAPQGLSLRQLTEIVYKEASVACLWGVVRRAAGWLDKVDPALEDAVAEILRRRHRVSVGRAYSSQAVIAQPLSAVEIMDRLRAYGGDDPRCRVLLQEIILFLGILLKTDPRPFAGIVTLRPRQLLLLLTGSLAREWRITRGEACEVLLKLSPNAILTRLRRIIADSACLGAGLAAQEALHYQGDSQQLSVDLLLSANDDGGGLVGEDIWSTWREINGGQLRLNDKFFQELRTLLQHCQGLVIGDQLDARNYLDSRGELLRADELDFAAQVENLLLMIQAPAYRQLNVEALQALAAAVADNPTLQVEDYLALDVLIGAAVQLTWREANPGLTYGDYNECCADAWSTFYASPPHRVAGAIIAAFHYLLSLEKSSAVAA